MKITWFGGRYFRIYFGGKIIVLGAGAPVGVDSDEFRSGADMALTLGNLDASLPIFDPSAVPSARRIIDASDDDDPVGLFKLGAKGLVLRTFVEPDLIIAGDDFADWGRFADGAIVLLSDSPQLPGSLQTLADKTRPKLLALAVADLTDELRAAALPLAGATSIQVLEPGLALEV